MAARLAPDNVRRMHQSLHHLVADAPWSDEEMLAQVRQQVLPAMQKNGPVVAWIVDDTGFPKQGTTFGGSCPAVLRSNRQTR
jgi:SRSO17 transposase